MNKPDQALRQLRRAIEHFGSVQNLASAIGCHRPQPYEWLDEGCLPVNWALAIEKASRGKIKAVDLPIRNRIFPTEVLAIAKRYHEHAKVLRALAMRARDGGVITELPKFSLR